MKDRQLPDCKDVSIADQSALCVYCHELMQVRLSTLWLLWSEGVEVVRNPKTATSFFIEIGTGEGCFLLVLVKNATACALTGRVACRRLKS